MRLQVFLSHSGVCSRRRALELVQSGRVRVNGLVIREPSHAIDGDKDTVTLNNQRVSLKEKQYILINKPKGVTTTKKDHFAEKTIMDILPEKFRHLFPVGRLDRDTTGLLILTNDGDFSYGLTHPSFNIDKVYLAVLDKPLSEGHRKQLQNGVEIDNELTAPCKISILEDKKAEITIHEGRKRQVRKMFALLGYRVLDLRRVRFGNLSLGDLKIGHWRKISEEELAKLKSAIKK